MYELRNNRPLQSAAILAVLVLVSVPLFNGGLGAQTPPRTNISHSPVDTFIPGFRMQVKALVSDETGVMLVRCYFRAAGEAEYMFVDMPLVIGNEYSGTLPAPLESTEALEYILLAVNNDGVVVRTQLFSARRAEGREKPVWQQVDSGGEISINTELSRVPESIPGFDDNIVVNVMESAFRFGYVVEGIYKVSQMVGAAPVGAISGGTISATTTSGTEDGVRIPETAAAATGGSKVSKKGSSGLLYIVGGAALVAGGVYAATKLLAKKKLPVAITVWDSGDDKDDTFDVYLDGEKLGTTSGPSYRGSWTRDLEEGSSHTVRVVCADDEHDNGVYCSITISNSNQAGAYEEYMSEGDEFSRSFSVNESGGGS